jgi:hypothetical protein
MVPMSDATNTEFTSEEILSQAQGNATAFVLTTFVYLNERGLDIDEFVELHGRLFAPAWEELRGEPVVEAARLAALNAVSVGATLRSLSGDDTRAEVHVAGWPDDEFLEMLQLSREDGERQHNAFRPIMEHLGIHYEWQREEDDLRTEPFVAYPKPLGLPRISIPRQSGK